MTETTPIPHVKSWYAASSPGQIYPVLFGETQADVCVIGGGIAGCSAALHLAQEGYQVVLLEGDRIGFGASGRSGGQCLPGVSCGPDKLEALIGPELARMAWDLSLEGLYLQQRLIAEHAVDCDWRPGHLQVCCHARHERELKAEMERLQDLYGYTSLEWLPREELRQHVGSDRYVSGLIDRNAGHLHPLKYTQGLAEAATKAGVDIREGSRALARVEQAAQSRRWQVRTALGQVNCETIILAGNATLGAIEPALGQKILGVGTYMIATESLSESLVAELLPTDLAVSDLNWIIDYFRLSADRRLLFGGEVSYTGLFPQRYGPVLQSRLLRVFPQLAGTAITHRWGGWLDITVNRAPHFGELAPGVYFVQGFSGHGLALATLAGKLLAEAVRGTHQRFDVFARIPHRSFPGGSTLRRPALALAMLAFRLRDLL